jgi:hypothetical protein
MLVALQGRSSKNCGVPVRRISIFRPYICYKWSNHTVPYRNRTVPNHTVPYIVHCTGTTLNKKLCCQPHSKITWNVTHALCPTRAAAQKGQWPWKSALRDCRLGLGIMSIWMLDRDGLCFFLQWPRSWYLCQFLAFNLISHTLQRTCMWTHTLTHTHRDTHTHTFTTSPQPALGGSSKIIWASCAVICCPILPAVCFAADAVSLATPLFWASAI